MYLFILILILLYIISYYVFPLLLPRILRFWLNRHQKSATQHANQAQETRKEGEIHIDYVPKHKNQSPNQKKMGEYVDFEDINTN